MPKEAPTLAKLAAKIPRNLTATPPGSAYAFGERGELRGEWPPACAADTGE